MDGMTPKREQLCDWAFAQALHDLGSAVAEVQQQKGSSEEATLQIRIPKEIHNSEQSQISRGYVRKSNSAIAGIT